MDWVCLVLSHKRNFISARHPWFFYF